MNDEQRLKFYVPEHLKTKPIIFGQEIGKVALCDSNEQNQQHEQSSNAQPPAQNS